MQEEKLSGFSLLQVLLVVAIFMVIVSLTVPNLYQWQTGVQINTIATEIGQNLRRAQVKAMSGFNNSNWGVYFSDNSYTIFIGDSYSGRDQSWDEDYLVLSSITMINDFSDEIIFSQNTGLPNTDGEVIISNLSGDIISITINELGVIEYR